MKRTVVPIVALLITLAAADDGALAQTPVVQAPAAETRTVTGADVEKEIALLRRNLRSEKKQLIALNLPLTDTEATKFWPVYDQYAAEMTRHFDDFYALIKDYAANQKTLTDAQAVDMLKRWSEIQVALMQTRQRYVPIVAKVIPGKKAAHFFQVDRRLYELMDLQVASAVPLVIQ